MKKRIVFFNEDQEYGSDVDKYFKASSDFVYLGWYQRFNKLISKLKTAQVDIILIELPGKIEPSIIQDLKKYNRSINLVVISAKDDHTSIRKALKSGAHGYLIKYVDFQETVQDLHKLAHDGVALS